MNFLFDFLIYLFFCITQSPINHCLTSLKPFKIELSFRICQKMTPFDSKHFDTVSIYKTGILKSAVPLRKVLLLCICFIELTWTLDGDELYQCCPHCYKLKCLLQKRFIVSNKFTLPLNHLLAASLSGAQLSLSCIIRGTHGFKPLWRHLFFFFFYILAQTLDVPQGNHKLSSFSSAFLGVCPLSPLTWG